MTVFFTASLEGKHENLINYQQIVAVLEKKEHRVIANHVLQANLEDIQNATENERIAYHNRLEKWINKCDFMIAESSVHSISVGYEISMALHKGKPVLILYKNGTRPPTLLNCSISERVVCEEYTTSTLESIIGDFINYIQNMHDTRFTFFITHEIASYLERVSKKQKKPKSVYLRELIEKDMRSS